MSRMPVGAHPDNIGKTVSAQVFKRSYENMGEILPDTLEKYVGVLEWYFVSKHGFMFGLRGCDRVVTTHGKHHVEITLV